MEKPSPEDVRNIRATSGTNRENDPQLDDADRLHERLSARLADNDAAIGKHEEGLARLGADVENLNQETGRTRGGTEHSHSARDAERQRDGLYAGTPFKDPAVRAEYEQWLHESNRHTKPPEPSDFPPLDEQRKQQPKPRR